MKFQVFEELEADTFVGDISESSIVKAMATNDNIKGELRYEFQGSLQTSFGIDESTGVIRTGAKIDRENVSLGLVRDTFQILVQVSKGVMKAAIPTEIKILDINDNSPIFKEDIENISVKESALGAELPITVAEDSDIGNNSVQSYEIVDRNDGGVFDLKVSRPTSEIFQVKLVVSKRLDREINDSYYLVIEARDGGSPPRVGRKGLSIAVLDSNDHFPKFSKDLYVGEVRENSPVGTFVLNVTATDKDIGTNGEVVYSLQVPPQYKDLFTLDARTGELRTNAALDYELSKDYQLQVTARDKGPDSIPSTAVVNVKVLDENDNKPEITVKLLPDAFDKQGKIPEDTILNTGVALVTVQDRDSGPNGLVTVTLQHHKQDFSLQPMFAGQYILIIGQPLSLDRHAQYKIKIVAEDQGKPLSQKNSYILPVKLADSNRHAPRFTRKVYDVNIGDDVTPGAVIARTTATDEDDGRNSELTYSVESVRIGDRNGSVEDPSKWFEIDNTGQVFVWVKLWCVFTSSFTVNIDVRDDGRVPRHGKTVLKVVVKCSQHIHNFSVAENKPEGVEVGRISLTSAAPDKLLRVRLATNTTDFALDEKKGILTTTRMLDREANSSYSLTAVLSDGSVEMDIILNVAVGDMNDNSPVFVGMVGSHNMTLSNAVFIGETILKLQAIDRDSGSNGLVKYSIVSGNNRRVFHMNERNGKISLRKALNEKAYTLTIRAADSGFIEKEAFLRLIISVKFITPAPPPSGLPGDIPATTKVDNGVVETRKGNGGFFSDIKMIIVVGACVGFLLLSVCLIAVFCLKFRRRNNKEEDKRGSYHEPDISREDALKASKKMFHQATSNPRQAAEAFVFTSRKQPIDASPNPIKKMHPTMTYKAPPGTGSPTGNSRPDMYYPFEQAMVEYHSSEDDLDSGRGWSSRGSSPYCAHSPPSKRREDDWRPRNHVKYPAPQYRARSPGMPPPPPPYEDVQRRKALVTISGVTHSTTDL